MKLQEILNRFMNDKKSKKYLILCLLLGILLMLLPPSNEEAITEHHNKNIIYSLSDEEKRLESALLLINGVGKCKVLLSVTTGTELVLAEDDGETLIISKGNDEETVTVLERYPDYRGAVVVIGGYSNANVRFDVLSAVMSYTGLGTDKITICPMEE